MIYGYEEVFICQQKIISFDLLMKKKTKELQKDWKGYGKISSIIWNCGFCDFCVISIILLYFIDLSF